MRYFIESERLGFRPLTAADFGHVHALNTDPDVMRYVTNGVLRTAEQTAKTIADAMQQYESLLGLGTFAAELKTNAAFVGLFVLRPIVGVEQVSGIELGYLLAQPHWGQGYATEGARRIMAYARDHCGLRRLVAIIDPHNADSRKVLVKVGFTSKGDATYKDPMTREASVAELFVACIEQVG